MGQSEFVKVIQNCRQRLNLADFMKKLVSALSIGAGVGILFQAAAFVMPLYYVGLYTGLALILALLAASVAAYAKRTSMEQTALVMDSFGFDERIVTAYGNLEKEGALVALQRADAMNQLQAHQDKIRIALLPPWKKTGFLMGLFAVLIVLALVPSEMKERARELHSVKEEAKEKTEEIQEVVEALEQLEQEEELTPEQQAMLQEMIESLQASQSEYQQVSSNEMMRAATEKLNYRYENMGSQLASLAQSLQNGATVSSVTAESLQALSNKMQEMSGAQLAKGNAGQSGNNGGNGQGSQNGQSGNNGNNGGNGQNGQNGSGGQNGQNGQNGQPGNNGNGGQNGNNDGNGEPGSGRGTGTADTPHDYVSIPNDIADSGNLTGNAVDHDASEYFHAQNGLSWEGTHMSHEAVIGSYEQNAYEGIAAGKYPSGMEEIIKAYFSNFN
ncbi:MAG: hypothetical protein K2N44_02305 [Lachnospiraceae bacterium]|nr:hypothetical protein [Lachnospiraceae bacterium]